MNHPDIINHPALPILARGDERLRNIIRRQGFAPRQFGPLSGFFAAVSSPFGVRILNTKLFQHRKKFKVITQ